MAPRNINSTMSAVEEREHRQEKQNLGTYERSSAAVDDGTDI